MLDFDPTSKLALLVNVSDEVIARDEITSNGCGGVENLIGSAVFEVSDILSSQGRVRAKRIRCGGW